MQTLQWEDEMNANNKKPTFGKPVLTIEGQADLLMERGLAGDRAKLCDILRYVNYYRLTGFLFPFKLQGSENYKTGLTVDYVWSLYTFDRRLRGLLFECISRLEIAFRTVFAYEHAIASGTPFCYAEPDCFDFGHMEEEAARKHKEKHHEMLQRIDAAVEQARGLRFMRHFMAKYANERPPVWMVVEVLSFGILYHYFQLLPKDIQINIAHRFGFTEQTFLVVLTALNRARNKCAHHERFLYSKIPTDGFHKYCSLEKNALLANLDEALRIDVRYKHGSTLYSLVCIMAHLLSIVRPESHWKQRFRAFMCDPANKNGRKRLPVFSDNKWEALALWRD